jgi:hypothetical protein
MTKRTRTLIALVAIEMLLAGGWFWLHAMAVSSPHARPESTQVIGQVFGAAMGIVLALSPVLYLFALRNDPEGKVMALPISTAARRPWRAMHPASPESRTRS